MENTLLSDSSEVFSTMKMCSCVTSVSENSKLSSFSTEGFSVLYDPELIKSVGDDVELPVSHIMDTGRYCAMLVADQDPASRWNHCPKKDSYTSLHHKGLATSIQLHNVPLANYIIRVNGCNLQTAKGNRFDFSNPRPNSMLESWQLATNKVGCLDFDRACETYIICPQDQITELPVEFEYTVFRPDGTYNTYTAFRNITHLWCNDYTAAIDVKVDNRFILIVDGEVILKITKIPGCTDDQRIRIHFHDSSQKYIGRQSQYLSSAMIESSLNMARIDGLITPETALLSVLRYEVKTYPEMKRYFVS